MFIADDTAIGIQCNDTTQASILEGYATNTILEFAHYNIATSELTYFYHY